MMLPWLGNRTFWFCLHTYLSSVGVHVCCACACQGELFLGNCGFLDYHHWRAFSFTSWSPCWFWFLVFKFSINTAIGILPDSNSTDKIYKIIKKNKQTNKLENQNVIQSDPTRLGLRIRIYTSQVLHAFILDQANQVSRIPNPTHWHP